MRSILILINKYFWKGMIGPVFAYLVPMVLVLFIGRILGASLIVPGVFMIPTLSILLIFMPQSVFEFRNSSLLKRIGTTPIKPWKFLLGISIFNIVIVCSAFLLIFVFCFIVFADQLSDKSQINSFRDLSYIQMIISADWGGYIYFNLQIILMCTLLGLFISAIAKSTLFIQCVGISIMLVSLFVGPCILPVALVGSVDVVKALGYIIPLKYPISASIEAFTSGTTGSIVNLNSSNVWDIYSSYEVFNVMFLRDPSKGYIINVFSPVDKALNLSMPWIFNIFFAYFVAATFRWNNRGKLKFRWRVFSELLTSIKNKINFSNKNDNIKKDVNSPYILEVEGLTRKFKTKTGELIANNNISFKIPRGRNLAILGHNGAGKTVLVETIVGVTTIQEGSIKYNFNYIKSFHEKIGIQFQDSSYPFGIKVKDIILFFIKAYKINISDDELEELLRKFGINLFFNKNASSLSGGQQQRINLLLAVLHKPEIIFLDELSTGLDIKIRNEIKEFIKDYAKKNNMTIIIVSHDMGEVEYLADDIMVLKDGKVQLYDSKKNILKKNKSLEQFLYSYL